MRKDIASATILTGFCLILYAQNFTIRDSIELVQRELDSTQNKLEELTKTVNDLAAKEKTSLERLELLHEKIAITERLIRQLTSQIERQNQEINELNAQLAVIIEQQQKSRQQLNRRLVNIYKYSKIFPLQAFLTSTSLPELYRRIINLRLVSRSDHRLILQLIELNEKIVAQRNAILAAKVNAEHLEADAEQHRATLLRDREEEGAILARIRTEKATKAAITTELQTAAERLKTLISDLQSRMSYDSEEKHYLEKNKGKLPWPVSGSIIASFGIQSHPRYRTRINNVGIDIKVKEVSPVKVIADGKVSYADRFIGYGNLVIVDHGSGYFTLYGNLTTVGTVVNALVSAGTTIGIVDDYLHFEIRKDGQPLNPKDWLE
ncbi:MAG: murein hydrolase activator EnvC family protein [bacterium]